VKRVYETGTVVEGMWAGRSYLLIRRKPSDIPIRLDFDLICLAGMSEMDGPNDRVMYIFGSEMCLDKAEREMEMRGWKKEEEHVGQ
jgi:hypothetical protein